SARGSWYFTRGKSSSMARSRRWPTRRWSGRSTSAVSHDRHPGPRGRLRRVAGSPWRRPRRFARRDLRHPREERDGEDDAPQDAQGAPAGQERPRAAARAGRHRMAALPHHASRGELRPPGEVDLPGPDGGGEPPPRAAGRGQFRRAARDDRELVPGVEGAAATARGDALGGGAEDAAHLTGAPPPPPRGPRV